jgi:nucleoside-diphosphate kinase
MGSTKPTEAAPGTVRADLALEMGRNLTHASDGSETAASEIALWVQPEELGDWTRDTYRWIFEK